MDILDSVCFSLADALNVRERLGAAKDGRGRKDRDGRWQVIDKYGGDPFPN